MIENHNGSLKTLICNTMKFLTTQFRRKMKVALIVITRKHKSSGWTRQTLLGNN